MDQLVALLNQQAPSLRLIANGFSLSLLAAYHLYLRQVFRRRPERTYRGRSDQLRTAWVDTMRVSGNEILAVQTLRNWVMSATLFASTSILIGLGVVNVALEGVDLSALSSALSIAPTSGPIVRLKLLLVSGLFFVGFLHFALALRYYNHTGFLINLPAHHFRGSSIAIIAETLNRGGGHYNRGTRSFLLATPLVLWLIGPEWFLAGTLGTLVLLYRFDFRSDPPAEAGAGRNTAEQRIAKDVART